MDQLGLFPIKKSSDLIFLDCKCLDEEVGVNFSGTVLAKLEGIKTVDSCRSHCQYDPLCMSFVHNAKSLSCWHNSKIVKKIFDRPSHLTSGLRNCKKAGKLYRKKYFTPNEESIKFKSASASASTSCSILADMMEISAFI